MGALTIGYVTTRYLADLIAAAAQTLCSLQLLLARAPARAHAGGRGRARARRARDQRRHTGCRQRQPAPSSGDRAAFVRAQDGVDRFLEAPATVQTAAGLPAPASGRVGDLLVVGRCAGFYVVNSFPGPGSVEHTPATGYHVLRLRDAKIQAQPRILLTERTDRSERPAIPGGVVFGHRRDAAGPRERAVALAARPPLCVRRRCPVFGVGASRA
mgnify:CR=1 FL=1